MKHLPAAPTILAAVVFSSLCFGNLCAEQLAAELKSRSVAEGLGIASHWGNSVLEVTYFDGRKTTREMRIPGTDFLYDVEPRSQVVLASNKDLPNALRRDGLSAVMTPSFALFSLDGHLIKPVGLPIGLILAVLSPDLNSVAVLLSSGPTRISLQYGPIDGSSAQEVFSADISDTPSYYREENLSWSSDQSSLVYSLKNLVYIFNLATRSSRSVAEGSDPCWSPDGRSIVYRSRDRNLMLYDVATGTKRQLTRWYNVTGFPRWSPDSKYIFFTESNPLLALRNLRTLPATEFMVIRVSDGDTAGVFTPGMGLENRRYYWVKMGPRP